MTKTIGIVEARSSNRLPTEKVARKLAGKSVLEWSVRHATDSLRLDGVVVAADRDAVDWIRDLVPADVPVVVGSPRDALHHFTTVLGQFPAAAVVRIPGDNPFLDPALIDRLVATASQHPNCDYISYHTQAGRWAIHAPLGLLAEWCRADALRQADREATETMDREQVTRFLYSHPERFAARWIPAPDPLDRHDLRLALVVEEDWEHAEAIFDALGHDGLDWQRIAGFLAQQPALRERMAELNRAAVAA
ncbi:MAG: NTP transferase domain-containing protein [Planctomycetaceae bacterium]|nr:NTP transferase domain-containing protein [Planctomycetaceae bacterium]